MDNNNKEYHTNRQSAMYNHPGNFFNPYQPSYRANSISYNKYKKSLTGSNIKGSNAQKMSHAKLIFINPYEKCSDFNYYKSFMNLNLKFLKQNYKKKDNNPIDHKIDMESNRMIINFNNILMRNMQNRVVAPNHMGNNIQINVNNNNNTNININITQAPVSLEENLQTGKYLKGIIRINKCHTHGYITVSGMNNDILVRGNRHLNQSLNMDEVIVELLPIILWKSLSPQYEKDSREFKESFTSVDERIKYINNLYNLRPEGRIVKILNSPNMDKPQISKVTVEDGLLFATPIDVNLPKIFIKMKKYKKNDFIVNKNKYYLVKIVGWAKNFKSPKGVIVTEIGNSGDIEVETEVLLRQHDIDYTDDYPGIEVLEPLRIEEELKTRRDLRSELVFTIDPYGSKDLDDAISIKIIDKDTGLLEIGVHIADPSHFVKKDSIIDKEALNRTTTLYLVHKNIPMLPRVLSEELCSLLPNQDRLAFSLVFRIYLDSGALDTSFNPEFFLSVINSKARLTYEQSEELIKKNLDEFEGNTLEKLLSQNLKILHQLTKLVRSQRIESGSIIIENQEIVFDLENDLPVNCRLKGKLDSHSLIEELMLIANKLTAELIYTNLKEHALLRRHPSMNLQEMQKYMGGISNQHDLNKTLLKLKAENLNKFKCIQYKLKTFMQRAEYVSSGMYDISEMHHSALNFDLYTHFTSPIRRYPDLVVHRQLKSILYPEHSHPIDYSEYIDNFNRRYINGKLISSKGKRIWQIIWLKSLGETKTFNALVVEIKGGGKQGSVIKNQPGAGSITFLIPELNMDIVRIFLSSKGMEKGG